MAFGLIFIYRKVFVMLLKEKILEELEKNSDCYVSGQKLADMFGVSRNAVWKAVNQLKEDGCKIQSVNNKGYRILSVNDVLSPELIKSYMSDKAKCLDLIVLDKVDSTNNEAKRMIANSFSGHALIVSNEQTNGRGRLGRDFYSPKNTGVYMSFLFSHSVKTSKAILSTTAAAVAVVRAVESLTNLKPMIKWVNDVYIENKKVCGILTEAVTDFETGLVQNVVVGIGINTSTEDFPDELKNSAVSLNWNGLSRNRLTAEVANRFIEICSDLDNKSYLKTYRERSLIIGQSIDFYKNNVKYNAVAVDIDDNGGLIVKLPNGLTEVLNSGEITVRLSKNKK